eukprot:CAMPEP_0174727780 /NCGR_PEP_ID=MMETSP1094-20130205/50488_1 /TAXON_ID=156173 /ORGANISM="Chrysochromulina brevifilum, Strain UTEX LB 985" /LENGTH=49 /DNA_ID=CAMNT_0015929601 /DNA_START=836 /DNA_END=985 /DNA_ORIENTATION=+
MRKRGIQSVMNVAKGTSPKIEAYMGATGEAATLTFSSAYFATMPSMGPE